MREADDSTNESLKTHVSLFHNLQSLEALQEQEAGLLKGLGEGSAQPLQTHNKLPPSGQAWRTEPLPEMPGHQFHPDGTRCLTDPCPCPATRASSLTPEPAPFGSGLVCGHVWILYPLHMRSQAGGHAAVPASPHRHFPNIANCPSWLLYGVEMPTGSLRARPCSRLHLASSKLKWVWRTPGVWVWAPKS